MGVLKNLQSIPSPLLLATYLISPQQPLDLLYYFLFRYNFLNSLHNPSFWGALSYAMTMTTRGDTIPRVIAKLKTWYFTRTSVNEA